jgi:predicted RNA-binding Zn-ribbon protein involved in translation (DUF1610 family)
MTRDEGRKTRCPECGWFVARITSTEAEIELNCSNGRCGATLIVRRENSEVTVAVAQKGKQAS